MNLLCTKGLMDRKEEILNASKIMLKLISLSLIDIPTALDTDSRKNTFTLQFSTT